MTSRTAERAQYAQLDLPMVALHEAKAFIGLEEEGDNRGPAVEFLQMNAQIPPGSPWCAAMVNACVHAACAKQNHPSPFEGLQHQGYVPDYIRWAEEHGTIIDPPGVMPGDLFALWHGGKGRYAHIGFVYQSPHDGSYSTIEGNTGDEGEREGYKVASRVREVSDGTAFIRWTGDG